MPLLRDQILETAPSEKMSVRASGRLSSNCSGARYGSVPSTGEALIVNARVIESDTCGSACRELTGQAEVEQLGARLREHDVSRLQIAMDDVLPVRAVQGFGHLDAIRHGLVERNLFAREPLRQRLPFDILHDQEVNRALLPDIVQRTDIGVIQLRDDPGLALESLTKLRVVCERGLQDLDGNRAIEAGVTGPVDLSHAAGTDEGLDLIRAEASAGIQQLRRDYRALAVQRSDA